MAQSNRREVLANLDPLNNRSTTAYDSAGRTVVSINSLNKRTTGVFNIAGETLATIDANGNRVSYAYISKDVADKSSFGSSVSI